MIGNQWEWYCHTLLSCPVGAACSNEEGAIQRNFRKVIHRGNGPKFFVTWMAETFRLVAGCMGRSNNGGPAYNLRG